jgi:hypothetical protein
VRCWPVLVGSYTRRCRADGPAGCSWGLSLDQALVLQPAQHRVERTGAGLVDAHRRDGEDPLQVVARRRLSHGTRLLLVQESVPTAVFGVACLGSLWARRPLMFGMALEFTGRSTAKGREMTRLWQYEGYRRSRYLQQSRGAGGCARSHRSASRSRQRRDGRPFPGGRVSMDGPWNTRLESGEAGTAVIKEATASTFVSRENPGGVADRAGVASPNVTGESTGNPREWRPAPRRADAHANNH